MKIRGKRKCTDCDSRWSYYETGSVACPDCGGLRSVGVDERHQHTASPTTLDLRDARAALGTDSLETVAKRGSEAAAAFVRKSGFIDAGELQPLDETFVVANELHHVGAELARSRAISDAEEAYLLALLDGGEAGERPAPEEVPDPMTAVRGLATATAIGDYHRDVRRYLEEHPNADARTVLGRIEDHRTRLDALNGDVPPENADRLVEAARAVGTALIEPDVTLDPARECLEKLDSNLS